MYLCIDYADQLRIKLDEAIPAKVRKKDKVLDELVTALGDCIDYHKENIKTGRGIVVGRDIKEVRYVTQVVANTKSVNKTSKAKKKRR